MPLFEGILCTTGLNKLPSLLKSNINLNLMLRHYFTQTLAGFHQSKPAVGNLTQHGLSVETKDITV
jgi:hypothetical protein